ncbi:MAG: hypothetical protein AB7G11_13140 [Phycisphaerales bacterium]
MSRRSIASTTSAALLASASAFAGGTPENAMLIIDPGNAQSMRIGNYYKNARNIPDSNVLYIDSAALNYPAFVATNRVAFNDALTNRGLADHLDYAVVAPLDAYYISAPGLVSDQCFAVTRFSIASAYTMSQITIAPNTPSTSGNNFFLASDTPTTFDSQQGYLGGSPSSSPSARRYYIGAMLGYLGPSGNSITDLTTMIDRSVMSDGSRPVTQTFYFENNLVEPCRNVRACTITNCQTQSCTTPTLYNASRASILARGGLAQVQSDFLPDQTDCIGIMTGDDILDWGARFNMVIQPGAFCDHLTSFGAAFENGSQTEISEWIARGAAGSAGTVEEPCNYNGKFPTSRFHVLYFQGMTLGECYLRTIQYIPFQNLLYGDPLSRPFDYIPVVNVADLPPGSVSGAIILTPSATTARPGASISGYDLLVDGVLTQSILFGQTFSLDTTTLNDGYHDLRVIARDNSFTRSTGRFAGSLTTANFGRAVSANASPASGNLAQSFAFNYTAIGGAVRDVRLVHNGRVLAASPAASGSISVFGQNLGVGASMVHLEALYQDNRIARSSPIAVTVSETGSPANPAPVTQSFTKFVLTPTTYVVEFPAVTDSDPASLSYTLVSAPDFAAVLDPASSNGYRLIRPIAGASGSETITYRATGPGGVSSLGAITLVYSLPPACPPDWNMDGSLNSQDFFDFLAAFFSNVGDYNHSGATDSQDFFDFVADFFTGC